MRKHMTGVPQGLFVEVFQVRLQVILSLLTTAVLAWPEKDFNNYNALLATLNVETELVELPFLVNDPKYGVFIHGEETALSTELAKVSNALSCESSHLKRIFRDGNGLSQQFVVPNKFWRGVPTLLSTRFLC